MQSFPIAPQEIFIPRLLALTFCLLSLFGVAAHAQDRLPTIAPSIHTEKHRKAAAEFEATRKVQVFGPLEPLMHSPQMMTQTRAMGDYLRYHSAIGNTLSELALLITAGEWTQDTNGTCTTPSH